MPSNCLHLACSCGSIVWHTHTHGMLTAGTSCVRNLPLLQAPLRNSKWANTHKLCAHTACSDSIGFIFLPEFGQNDSVTNETVKVERAQIIKPHGHEGSLKLNVLKLSLYLLCIIIWQRQTQDEQRLHASFFLFMLQATHWLWSDWTNNLEKIKVGWIMTLWSVSEEERSALNLLKRLPGWVLEQTKWMRKRPEPPRLELSLMQTQLSQSG